MELCLCGEFVTVVFRIFITKTIFVKNKNQTRYKSGGGSATEGDRMRRLDFQHSGHENKQIICVFNDCY